MSQTEQKRDRIIASVSDEVERDHESIGGGTGVRTREFPFPALVTMTSRRTWKAVCYQFGNTRAQLEGKEERESGLNQMIDK